MMQNLRWERELQDMTFVKLCVRCPKCALDQQSIGVSEGPYLFKHEDCGGDMEVGDDASF